MFMDDTDLLHWASSPDTSDEDFIKKVQAASDDYGTISQATGAILKPEKSSVYFMFYKFVNGRARLKKLSEFPPAIAEVTTKDGGTAPAHITIP